MNPSTTLTAQIIALYKDKRDLRTTAAVKEIMSRTMAKESTIYQWISGLRNPGKLAQRELENLKKELENE